MVASFATLVESASGASGEDREQLFVIGGIVGSWGALLVLFAVTSTVGIVAEQRSGEIELLRTIGATTRQARSLIVFEALVVALFAACGGVLIAWTMGATLFRSLQEADLLTAQARYDGGPVSLGAAAGAVVLVGALAAAISSRRAACGPAAVSRRVAQAPLRRLPGWRVMLGVGLIAAGAGGAIVTVTVSGNSDDPYAAMQTSGDASIIVGIGMATLGPLLLRGLAMPLRRLLGGTGSAYLAAQSTVRRPQVLAGMLGPSIVFVSTAVGALLMIGIDARTREAAGIPADVAQTITTINLIIVGMICLFAAIMVVNATVAVVAHRRAELDQIWRLGATRGQLLASIAVEATVVAACACLLGLLGSTATAVPFSIVRDEGVVPDGQLWLVPLVPAIATALTLAAALTAVGAAQRRPPR
jgi:putative ABC transport system permease protein